MRLKSLAVVGFSLFLGIGFESLLAYVHHLEGWIDVVKSSTSLPPELWESVITRPHPRASLSAQLEMSFLKASASASWITLACVLVWASGRILQPLRVTLYFWITLVMLLAGVGVAAFLESIYTLQLTYPWARMVALSLAACTSFLIVQLKRKKTE